MRKQEEIIEVAGKKVRYSKDTDTCSKCCLAQYNGVAFVCPDSPHYPCKPFNTGPGLYANFVEVGQPEEETHSLREWAKIMAERPDLRAEFDKLRKISTPAEENWFEIQKQWEREDSVDENEKVREELIQYLRDYPHLHNGNYSRMDFFAWLERTCELLVVISYSTFRLNRTL